MRCRHGIDELVAAATTASSSAPPGPLGDVPRGRRCGGARGAYAAATSRPTSRPAHPRRTRPPPRCSGRSGSPGRSGRRRRCSISAQAPASPPGRPSRPGPGSRRSRSSRRSRRWCAPGRRSPSVGRGALREARWTASDVGAAAAQADLVLVSYVIGELEPAALPGFAAHAWSLAADTLVIVEPGTTAGYERVLAVRSAVIAAGGSTLAPCPHDDPCPLTEGDWCHFATRLARSRTHRAREGRGARLRGREVRLRRALPLAPPAAGGARDPPPRPAARARRARPLHGGRARAAHGLEDATAPRTGRRASSAGATRSELTRSG